MNIRRSTVVVSAGLLGLAVCAGCSGKEPERQIRDRIAAAAEAAEARNSGFFHDLIAAGFVDSRGNDRQAILSMMRSQFRLHPRIHVVSRIETISVESPEVARTVLVAGLAGTGIPRLQLGELDAGLYRIELEWAWDAGDWRVIGAQWSAFGER